MQIEFAAQDRPQQWFNTIANQFGAKVHNGAFEIPPGIGEGIFRQFYFFEGLTLTYLHFRLSEPLEFIRCPVKEARLIPIMFYSQEKNLEQEIDRQKTLIGYHTCNGIFMPSPQIASRWVVPSGIWDYQITITIEKNWFLSSLKEDSYLQQTIGSKNPFYLFETLTPEMMHIIADLHQILDSTDNKLQKFNLHQKTMHLLTLFLDKIEQRDKVKDYARLNASDVEVIFRVRKQLLESIHKIPTLKEMASDAGMSISKLQKCFRQVFGKSVSEYSLTEKMEMARQMLASKKLSVSEVGYRLGYSNLSHFTKAFYKQFGINPKAYLNSLK